jgi:hypothetical protein
MQSPCIVISSWITNSVNNHKKRCNVIRNNLEYYRLYNNKLMYDRLNKTHVTTSLDNDNELPLHMEAEESLSLPPRFLPPFCTSLLSSSLSSSSPWLMPLFLTPFCPMMCFLTPFYPSLSSLLLSSSSFSLTTLFLQPFAE